MSHDHFSFLKEQGFEPVPNPGSGNCLFISLANQIYGDDSRDSEIRAKCVAYMREHSDDFKHFINLEIGGGYRRNAARTATRRRYATRSASRTFTSEEIDVAFNAYLLRMSEPKEYGTHLEVQAFTKVYGWDVLIYQEDKPVGPLHIQTSGQAALGIARIAYHESFSHYTAVKALASSLDQTRTEPLPSLPSISIELNVDDGVTGDSSSVSSFSSRSSSDFSRSGTSSVEREIRPKLILNTNKKSRKRLVSGREMKQQHKSRRDRPRAQPFTLNTFERGQSQSSTQSTTTEASTAINIDGLNI